MSLLEYVKVGGMKTACLSRQGLVRAIATEIETHKGQTPPKLLFDANGHALALAIMDRSYLEDMNKADIIHADGQPLVIASRLLTKTPIPERSATTDLFHDVARSAAADGVKFFLLGGTEEVNKACAEKMQQMYPSLDIAGRRNGYFAPDDEAKVCQEINESGANVIWVGLGKPLEQAFCVRNRDRLNAAWLITCGGCFNYVTGAYARAPEWMQKAGLEWVHRLLTEPRKLGWRYFTTTPLALILLFARTSSKV
jgi:N-acetylglucosaminyldiphosphoundecaprenol N-acetyl-beta-D-mannosaminyltransferase